MKVRDKTPPLLVYKWRAAEERKKQIIMGIEALAVFGLSFVFGFLVRNLLM